MTQGHRLFADELTRLAVESRDPRLATIAAGITEPVRVAVCGRRGVGRRSVAAALAAAGVHLAGRGDPPADATVYVVAEAVKPEDTAALTRLAGWQSSAGYRRPVLAVLNKSDLSGHCEIADLAAAGRVPARPMSALFALAALDGRLDSELWGALRQLAAGPADPSCAERFAGGPHRVPRQVRERLCAVLDLSGVQRTLELARRGGDLAQARAQLRRLSGVDGVLAHLTAVAAGVRHRRISEAVARLAALAVGEDPAGRLDEFLISDAMVAARMAAAAAAVQRQWVPDEPALQRVRRWQARRCAPLGAVQRGCAADIVRGSLRDFAATRGRS